MKNGKPLYLKINKSSIKNKTISLHEIKKIYIQFTFEND
jgi:hypothetical protein